MRGIAILGAFVAAAKKDNKLFATLTKIDPVAGSIVDA